MLIALSVFLILILLALSRIFLAVSYDRNGFSGYIKFLFFKVGFPRKSAEKTSGKEPEQEKKPGDFNQLKTFLSPLFKTLGKFARMLTVNHLIADVSIGSDDAFNTAIAYGATCAGIGSILPFLDSNIKIKKKQISVIADFEKAASTIYLHANISLHLWQIIILAMYLLYQYIKNMKGFDKNGRTRTQ